MARTSSLQGTLGRLVHLPMRHLDKALHAHLLRGLPHLTLRSRHLDCTRLRPCRSASRPPDSRRCRTGAALPGVKCPARCRPAPGALRNSTRGAASRAALCSSLQYEMMGIDLSQTRMNEQLSSSTSFFTSVRPTNPTRAPTRAVWPTCCEDLDLDFQRK